MDERERYIEESYTRYAQRLRRFCHRYVGYGHEYDDAVEECVQDVFISAYRAYDILRKHPNEQAWLYKTCSYRLQDKVKREQRHFSHIAPFKSLDAYGADEDVEKALYTQDLREELASFFDTLPPRERALLYGRYVEQRSVKSLARALSMKESTAKVTLMRLRQRARKFFTNTRDFSVIIVTLLIFQSFH